MNTQYDIDVQVRVAKIEDAEELMDAIRELVERFPKVEVIEIGICGPINN